MPRDYKDITGKNNVGYKHGYALTGKKQGFYNSWQNMKQRCLNPNHPKYKNYGARGISVCDEWLDIKNFAKWCFDNGWEKGLQIDRIDNDGNYCPENCQLISVFDNSRKKSTTKISRKQADLIRSRVANGESEYELAKEFGVVHGTIWFIVNNYTHVDKGECTKALKRRNDRNNT